MAEQYTLIRLPQVRARLGQRSRAFLYVDVTRGLLTHPVKIGPRAAGWPEHEIDQVVAARIRGASDAEIRDLVIQLEAGRGSLGVAS